VPCAYASWSGPRSPSETTSYWRYINSCILLRHQQPVAKTRYSSIMYFKTLVSATVFAAAAVGVQGERHVVSFVNNCGFGSPRLIQGSTVLSSGGPYARNSPLVGAIAYLQTGGCGFDGVGCTVVETTLRNHLSSTDISLIPPLKFSVATGFRYSNGCDGQGAACYSAGCQKAYRKPEDHFAQVNCEAKDVNLVITFC
ncbi:hypothetical protein BD779DRAFT_1540481, partial [Infundibulicybe gibba]